MQLLVLVTDYPTNAGGVAMMYVHTRNKYYVINGISITVLNFSAKEGYIIDNIPVISLKEYESSNRYNYDILICHAPNIRNHYHFLKNNQSGFPTLIFFFHGHEVTRINKAYPKPFKFIGKSLFLRRVLQDTYDIVKLKLWQNYYQKLAYKSRFIFVSKSMYEEFLYYTKIDSTILDGRYSIISNSVGEMFEKKDYNPHTEKLYDFISIRSSIDGSSYCVDFINKLAMSNPELNFLIIGKGNYFKHIKKADNIVWINRRLTHEEIIPFLNQARCSLMPTRRDTQGVMSCEMATFGMPVITSDIPVCREIFENFENVALINNNITDVDLRSILNNLVNGLPYEKNKKYFSNQTMNEEIKLFINLMSGTV